MTSPTSLPFQASTPLPPLPPELANIPASPSQARAIRKVWASAWKDAIPGIQNADGYEVKSLRVSPARNAWIIQITMGMKNDEHTMASVFCRTYATLTVTNRGAIYHHRPHERIKGKYVYESCGDHLYRVWTR